MNQTALPSAEALATAAPAPPGLPVTIVIPVKNEAGNLPGCLRSLPPGARVVVVDSASTDASLEIARDAGAETVAFHWAGGFPKKRNWVLQTYPFTTEWVLFLDADERLTPGFIAELERALSRRDVAGYWLRYDNHFLGLRLRHGVPQRKLALFRVGAGLYERIEDAGWTTLDMEVHEHPILDGPLGEITAPLEHLDRRSLHAFIARHNDYSTWEARRYVALAREETARRLTFRQWAKYRFLTAWWYAPAYFLYAYVARKGFLDGAAGFRYAALKSQYFAHIRLKIRETRP